MGDDRMCRYLPRIPYLQRRGAKHGNAVFRGAVPGRDPVPSVSVVHGPAVYRIRHEFKVLPRETYDKGIRKVKNAQTAGALNTGCPSVRLGAGIYKCKKRRAS